MTDAESVLARAKAEGRARLRVYIGAAPGVGKTYQMLEDAHELKRQGMDVVVGFVETHGRADTLAQIRDLEQVPLRHMEYRAVTLREMDQPGAVFLDRDDQPLVAVSLDIADDLVQTIRAVANPEKLRHLRKS